MTIEELQSTIASERELMLADMAAFEIARRKAQELAFSALRHSQAVNSATQELERMMAHMTINTATK